MSQQWLTIVIVVLIIAIVIDGVRRMLNARRDSIKMSLRARSASDEDDSSFDEDTNLGSEFPNGGARPSGNKIDPERIKQVRSKYNFGDDMPKWRQQIAAATGKKNKDDKIEPCLGESDPLMDNFDETFEDAEISNELSPELEPQQEPVPEPEQESLPEREEPVENTRHEPVQTSLNLEDSVPMLMETLEEVAQANKKSNKKSEKSRKKNKPADNEVEIEVDTSAGEQPQTIQTVAKSIASTQELDLEQEAAVDTYSANKPRYESKYVDHSQAQEVKPEEVLIIHLRSREGEVFEGSDILEVVLESGLRFGTMDIFHCHTDEDGEGPVLFSMANMVKPGSFDLNNIDQFTTIGLSFFLTLPVPDGKHMNAFERMISTAKQFVDKLGGELKDENRSVMTGQTIEHYRERVRDFARRQQLEKSKL